MTFERRRCLQLKYYIRTVRSTEMLTYSRGTVLALLYGTIGSNGCLKLL